MKIFNQIIAGGLSDEVGAVGIFLGVTKKVGLEDKEVSLLTMESYEDHANPAILNICSELEKKCRVSFVRVYHLVGDFRVGEPIVFVAVGGEHRDDVFLALREAVERYKSEPALFKKEVYVNGSHSWIGHA